MQKVRLRPQTHSLSLRSPTHAFASAARRSDVTVEQGGHTHTQTHTHTHTHTKIGVTRRQNVHVQFSLVQNVATNTFISFVDGVDLDQVQIVNAYRTGTFVASLLVRKARLWFVLCGAVGSVSVCNIYIYIYTFETGLRPLILRYLHIYITFETGLRPLILRYLHIYT